MSKENKNKEKQRNSAGYVEPDRKVEKKKIACFVLLRVHLGVLVLSRSRSQCECLRVCVLHHQSKSRASGVRGLDS